MAYQDTFQSTHSYRVRPFWTCFSRSRDNNFNPRTHIECDGREEREHWYMIDFNPRTHIECDATELLETALDALFQSTHSYRVRLLPGETINDLGNFNPRTHIECDRADTFAGNGQNNFNPRTHIECDYKMKLPKVSKNNFNPRTHIECDAKRDRLSEVHIISIHALI